MELFVVGAALIKGTSLKAMKLLKVLELSAALLLMLLLKLCHNNVEALAKEDLAMENVKDIDFYKRSIHSDAFDVDAGSTKNGTTSLTLSQHDEKEDNDNGKTKVHSRGKRFIAFPVGSSFSVSREILFTIYLSIDYVGWNSKN